VGRAINEIKEELFEEVKDVPYELPEGWRWVKLEDIVEINPESVNPVKDFGEGTFTYIDISSVENYTGRITNPKIIVAKKAPSRARRLIKHRDILLSTVRPYLMAHAFVSSEYENQVCSTGFAVLRVKNEKQIYPKYLWFSLFSEALLRQYERLMMGASYPALNNNQVRALVIPLPFKDSEPDFEKQKQIVERIEALFKEIDKAIELRQKAIEETRKLFDSVLDRIFREAEEDKKNWKWVKLKDLLASLESGKRPRGGAVENGIPSIGGEHLNSDGGFNFHKMKYIPEDFYKTLKKGKIQINDILVVKDGATTGKVSFVSEEFPYKKAAVNEHIFILRVKNDYIPKYVFWFLFSPAGQKEILKNFGGAAQGGINRKFVKNVDIPIPITKNGKLDLQKQRQIAEYLDSIHNKIKQLIVLQSIQLEKFGQLKESILNKAFRGELI